MAVDETKITVAHLVATMDRIDQWLGAVRKGLEALPQDQEINVEVEDFKTGLDAKQILIQFPC